LNKRLQRNSVSSGTYWEEIAGYARAVRVGDRILVSGTTATGPDDQVVGEGDAGAQARFILDKIEKAIVQLGGTLNDVVRTRIYVRDLADVGPIRPGNTLIMAQPVGDEYLVEIEAEAIAGAGDAL
jgi:enamine deaminase RidA (YjgF/YER057c/UK114 family)